SERKRITGLDNPSETASFLEILILKSAGALPLRRSASLSTPSSTSSEVWLSVSKGSLTSPAGTSSKNAQRSSSIVATSTLRSRYLLPRSHDVSGAKRQA